MADSYEAIAGVIGQEMDNAWKRIMEKLAAADATVLTAAGAGFKTADLKEFFANLGGANMAIDFSSRIPKGQVRQFSAYKISPAGEVNALGVSGSISIGVNVTF
jgi:hypothetical protein